MTAVAKRDCRVKSWRRHDFTVSYVATVFRKVRSETMKRPVTILSGFLGSGKTTLLNQMLKADHGLRIAVMINDFGDVNIDKDLVIGQTGNVVELSGGCLCCTIRGDLLDSARALLTSGRVFDYLIVETSGLAEPFAVAQTFLVPELEESFRLDAVVTVVDSANIEPWLEHNETAAEQIRCADLLVMNKLDLVTPDDVDRLKTRLADINADAKVLPSINGNVPAELLLDVDAHKVATVAGHHHHDHVDHGAVLSVSFAAEIELDYDRFDQFLQGLPEGVFRAKGSVAIQGLSRRVIFHRVGGRNVLDQGTVWGEQPRSCRAVFLGQDFDRNRLLTQFQDCVAQPSVTISR
jgi:G3E family GTPase